MGKLIFADAVERVIKDYFIRCIEQGATSVEVTEASADLCRAVANIPIVGVMSDE